MAVDDGSHDVKNDGEVLCSTEMHDVAEMRLAYQVGWAGLRCWHGRAASDKLLEHPDLRGEWH